MFDGDGRLWALSTIPGADPDDQLGGLHRINLFADGRLEATRIHSFPGLKPEGICTNGNGRFTIVFDNDDETPFLCQLKAEDL